MKERKSIFPQLLIIAVVLAIVGVLIGTMVGGGKQGSTLFTRQEVFNKDNEIAFKLNILSGHIEEEQASDIRYIVGQYTEVSPSKDKFPVELSSSSIKNYVFITNVNELNTTYRVSDEAGVVYTEGEDGIRECTLIGYFQNNIVSNLSKYKFNKMTLDSNQNRNIFGWQEDSIKKESWFASFLPTLISFLLIIIIGVVLFRSFSKSVGGANNKALDFNKSRARKVEASNVRFTDVAGCDEEKQEMREVVDYLKNPSKYTQAGAKLPKGILLVGSPGTGKTLLAKAVAGEAGVPFFSISGSDFVEMFVGVGAGRVRDMFKTAKHNAPCIIFIDEIDAVGRQRGAGLGGGNDEREQTLNQLLVELDGFADNSGIIVMAATNRDDVLDPALLRAGRFDRKITVSLPDRKAREEIFKVHSRNKKIDSNVDFANIAKRTVGFSGADIATIMNDAAILSIRNKTPFITLAEIDEAIDRRIAGPAKSSRSMTEKERKTVAYHEAGHAIIGLNLADSDKVQKITIVPRGNTGGHVLMTPENDRFLVSKRELMARITGYLGGRTSEEIFFDDISTGASNDIEVATHIARAMVVEYGMSKLGPIQYEENTGSVFLGRDYTSAQKNFSSEVAIEIDKEIRSIIDSCHEEAKKIILEHQDDLILIANTLLERESITSEQIDYLLEHRTMDGFDSQTTIVVAEVSEAPVDETPEDDIDNTPIV